MSRKLMKCIKGFYYSKTPDSKTVWVRARTEVYSTDPATQGPYSEHWVEKENDD